MKNEIDLCSVSKYKLKYDIPEEQILTNDKNGWKNYQFETPVQNGIRIPTHPSS